ncbi:CIS tube protein [Pseudomonas syringae]|uniref:CIS tube protein n=1 Tax=Pseudomonas syringae TaxID=317 RepID=UPI001F1BA507|nr:LysM peptidoglycan-binding domain-containing protein [Pseudomonas syringae]
MSNMRIVAYCDEKFTEKMADGEYEVMLNPEKLQWGRQIEYSEESAPDTSAPSSKYSKSLSQKLSFELVIDCTGVVDATSVHLPDEMKQLSKVIYDYNGDIHRPNYLIINWGAGLAFRGVLTSFSTSYTFFKPDGTPLRARVSLEFSSYIDPTTLARREKKASPDMSHLIRVVEGDTLPQIANRIYRDSAYYVQLAQFNNLDKFRQLRPGIRLSAPPLIAQEAGNV